MIWLHCAAYGTCVQVYVLLKQCYMVPLPLGPEFSFCYIMRELSVLIASQIMHACTGYILLHGSVMLNKCPWLWARQLQFCYIERDLLQAGSHLARYIIPYTLMGLSL